MITLIKKEVENGAKFKVEVTAKTCMGMDVCGGGRGGGEVTHVNGLKRGL